MPPQHNEQPCPQCGSMMSFRLGEFECESCGHRQPAVKPQEERSSGPGFRKEQWGSSASSAAPSSRSGSNFALPGQYQGTPAAPPPPPPGSTFYGQQYNELSTSQPSSSLQTEKAIYMGLVVAGWIIIVLFTMFSGGDEGGIGAGFALLLQGTVNTAVQWFVLYGTVIWAKWACLVCNGIQTAVALIGVLIGFFMIPAITKEVAAASGDADALFTPFMITFVLIYILIAALFTCWFLWIIYRDIQERSYQ